MTDNLEGIKTYEIETGCCLNCRHSFVEEVSYDYFIAVDLTSLHIPNNCPPPAIVCMKTGNMKTAKCQNTCNDFEEVEE